MDTNLFISSSVAIVLTLGIFAVLGSLAAPHKQSDLSFNSYQNTPVLIAKRKGEGRRPPLEN